MTHKKLPLPLRLVLITVGACSVVCGLIGIVLPGVPTTPFLLLAGVCFSRSSTRLDHWLHHNPLFGEYLRNYRDRRGILPRHRTVALCALWIVILSSVLFAIHLVAIKLLLLLIAILVTVHLFSLATLKPENEKLP